VAGVKSGWADDVLFSIAGNDKEFMTRVASGLISCLSARRANDSIANPVTR
jgi:hypothetical protein